MKIDEEAALDSTVVLVPMTKLPEAPKLTNVPKRVAPGPPADIVLPAIEKAVGFGVKV